MRVTLVGPAHPLRGGIANFNEALCKAYLQAGNECEIVSYYFQYPNFLFPGTTQFSADKAPESLQIKNLVSSINPISWGKSVRYILKSNPDLVVFNYWMPFMVPSIARIARRLKKRGVRTIALVHNLIPHESMPLQSVLIKYFARSFDKFLAMSHAVCQDIDKHTSKATVKFNPHPVYNIFGDAVDRSKAIEYLGLKSDTKYLLFFGLIRKYKGLDLILEALPAIKERIKNLKLIIAGEFYDDKEVYLKLIDSLGLRDDIILLNKFIPNDDVKYYFSAADIVVQPYKTATQSGITQIAYHFDKPMLVTNVGGLAEIVPHKKVGYVTEIDEVEIANSIIDFYENNRSEEFINEVKKEKERFSWDKMVATLNELADL